MRNASDKVVHVSHPKINAEKNQPPFDPDRYEANKGAIAYIMGNFFLRHFNFLYREFEGDLIMAMVLGEIGHHNVSSFYSNECKPGDIHKREVSPSTWRKDLHPTNAYSLSEATGIPRETIRRKIDKLLKKGWVVKSENSELTISDTVSDYFTKDFNKKTLAELFDASKCLMQLMGMDGKQT